MDCRERALQFHGRSQLRERQVGLFGQQFLHPLVMTGQDQPLPPRIAVPRRDVSGLASLLQELLHHAK